MSYTPAIKFLAVCFFVQAFFGYTQQVAVKCTDYITDITMNEYIVLWVVDIMYEFVIEIIQTGTVDHKTCP